MATTKGLVITIIAGLVLVGLTLWRHVPHDQSCQTWEQSSVSPRFDISIGPPLSPIPACERVAPSRVRYSRARDVPPRNPRGWAFILCVSY